MTDDLLSWRPPVPPIYDGATYSQQRDGKRLNAQCQKVFDVMKDGQWRTLREISDMTGAPEASVSARLRDFRKVAFLSAKVEREFVRQGLHRYRLVVP